MNQRERTIASILGGALGLFGLYWGYQNFIAAPLAEKEEEITAKSELLSKRKTADAESLKNETEFKGWRKTALSEVNGKTLYVDLLHKVFEKAKINNRTINPVADGGAVLQSRGKAQTHGVLKFTLQATASMDQWVKFLAEFRSVPVLHQIRRMQINPTRSSGTSRDLDITLTVEAITMPDVDPKTSAESLASYDPKKSVRPTAPANSTARQNDESATKVVADNKGADSKSAESKRADAKSVSADKSAAKDVGSTTAAQVAPVIPPEIELLVVRNPFQPTRIVDKPRATKSVERPKDERADYKFSSAWVADGKGEGNLQNVKSTGKSIAVTAGGKIEIAGLSAEVVDVDQSEMTLRVGGRTGRLRLGETLDKWKADSDSNGRPRS
jgi:hypothetical protein